MKTLLFAVLSLLAQSQSALGGDFAASAPSRAIVHPLLLGPMSDPESPISQNLSFHAVRMTESALARPLTPDFIANYLASLEMAGPVERASARVLSRVAAEPDLAHRFQTS